MGKDLPRPGDDAGRRRSPCPPRYDLRDERGELSPPRCPRTQTRLQLIAGPSDNTRPPPDCRAATLKTRAALLRDNNTATIMPPLRCRVSYPDCRCIPILIVALQAWLP